MTEVSMETASKEVTGNAKLIYILYLVGIVLGITALVGLIMAYVNKNDSDSIANSHYQFQIRTFWIGLLFLFIGGLSSIFLIGWLVILFWIVWVAVRSVKGMKLVDEGKAHPNPKSWMFG